MKESVNLSQVLSKGRKARYFLPFYSESLAIEDLLRKNTVSKISLGLERVKKLLAVLGNPHYSYKVIQIVGTNGKGSVAATLESILRNFGFKTGIYTSPHLVSVLERIRIDGKYIDAKKWNDAIKSVLKAQEKAKLKRLTYFEFLTVLASLIFAEEGVDVAVFEAGLGGRYDATSALDRLDLLILTSVGIDHKDYLGQTLSQIFMEKAFAHRNNAPVLVGIDRQLIDGLPFFFERQITGISKPFFIDDCYYRSKFMSIYSSIFDLWIPDFGLLEDLETPLLGKHQLRNVSVAVLGSILFFTDCFRKDVSDINGLKKVILDGVFSTKWYGRFQILRSSPYLIIDGAHNIDGIKMLVHTISDLFNNNKRFTVVFSAMKDKDFTTMLRCLLKISDRFVLTEVPDNPRSLSKSDLLRLKAYIDKLSDIPVLVVDPEEVFGYMNGDTIVCGSLYFLGWCLKQWKWFPEWF